jgi:branched-chain amino acid aminotransferase
MAAGTAAALVPIRSVTRRVVGGLPADSPRVTVTDADETVAFLPEDQEEPGPVCQRLLTQLKAVQLGKADDAFGWNVTIGPEDLELAA